MLYAQGAVGEQLMSKFKRFLKSSFGAQLPIRQRFFNIIFAMGFLVGIAGVLACMSLNSSNQAIMVSAVMTLAFPLFAYIGIRVKSRQDTLIVVALIVVNFVIFPALYLSGGNIFCGIPSYFCLGLALTLFLAKGKAGYILTTLESFWYMFIYFVSWKWPNFCIDVPAFSMSETGKTDFQFNAVNSNTLMVCVALGLLAKIIFSLYQKEAKIVENNIIEVERQSIIDPLTAVYNRRFMYSYITEQIEVAKRNSKPLSVVLFDIDFFKNLNDTYGHLLGDDVLKAISSILKNSCKGNEIVARYGGEEFLLILPNFTEAEALERAEEIRECVEKSILSPVLSKDKPVTISGGVATLKASTDEEKLIATADENLYKAKENGRNRIVSEEVSL